MEQNQILGPGVFRLILANFVVASHLSKWNLGEPAVFVFFILSGFWVSQMYLRKYSRYEHPLRSFYLSRFLRVWPVYAVAVTLSILVIGYISGGYNHSLWASLPLFGVASHKYDALQIAWALDIELQFYLFVPVLVALCAGTTRKGLLFALSLVATGLGWYVYYLTGIKTLLCYLPVFLAGVYTAVHGVSFDRRIMLFITLAFFAIVAIFFANDTLRLFFDNTAESPFNDEWLTMALVLLLLPFITHNVRQKSGWLDSHLGNISYSLYLVHYPLIVSVLLILGRDMTIPEKLLFLFAATPISVLFYVVFDRPLMRFRNWVMRRNSTRMPKVRTGPKQAKQ